MRNSLTLFYIVTFTIAKFYVIRSFIITNLQLCIFFLPQGFHDQIIVTLWSVIIFCVIEIFFISYQRKFIFAKIGHQVFLLHHAFSLSFIARNIPLSLLSKQLNFPITFIWRYASYGDMILCLFC